VATTSKAASTTERLRRLDFCTVSTSCSVLISSHRQQATFPDRVSLPGIPPMHVLGSVVKLFLPPKVLPQAQHLQGALLVVQRNAQNQRVDQTQRRDKRLDERVEVGHRRQRDVGQFGQGRDGVVGQHDGGNVLA